MQSYRYTCNLRVDETSDRAEEKILLLRSFDLALERSPRTYLKRGMGEFPPAVDTPCCCSLDNTASVAGMPVPRVIGYYFLYGISVQCLTRLIYYLFYPL